MLAKKADAQLAGTSRARERVIPITRVTGTYDDPRLELDQKALAALAYAYTSDDKVKKKLDKALGPGAGEAVQGVLDGLLGGGSKKQDR